MGGRRHWRLRTRRFAVKVRRARDRIRVHEGSARRQCPASRGCSAMKGSANTVRSQQAAFSCLRVHDSSRWHWVHCSMTCYQLSRLIRQACHNDAGAPPWQVWPHVLHPCVDGNNCEWISCLYSYARSSSFQGQTQNFVLAAPSSALATTEFHSLVGCVMCIRRKR